MKDIAAVFPLVVIGFHTMSALGGMATISWPHLCHGPADLRNEFGKMKRSLAKAIAFLILTGVGASLFHAFGVHDTPAFRLRNIVGLIPLTAAVTHLYGAASYMVGFALDPNKDDTLQGLRQSELPVLVLCGLLMFLCFPRVSMRISNERLTHDEAGEIIQTTRTSIEVFRLTSGALILLVAAALCAFVVNSTQTPLH